MKAHSDKLQIITLEENLSWERMQHAKVIARKETIDELTREVQDQRQRMSQYEAKIQELVSCILPLFSTLTSHP